jgi:hypothetical protein
VALVILLPELVILTGMIVARPCPSDRILLAGLLWGLLACAAYDAFRLPSIYAAGWWQDFFGSVGGWATGTRSNYLVGYLWRYAGDGGGISVVFFALATTLGVETWLRRHTIALAVAYAICPVWMGLVMTDWLAAPSHRLFPLTLSTIILSLVGHLIYGSVLGFGYWKSRHLAAAWPLSLRARHISPSILSPGVW